MVIPVNSASLPFITLVNVVIPVNSAPVVNVAIPVNSDSERSAFNANWLVTVVAKLASSFNAADNSFSVSSVAGAADTIPATSELT